MKAVFLKLAGMRKERDFVVTAHTGRNDENQIMIQSDKQIGLFDAETGVGIFNMKGCYFIHLNSIAGAKPLTLTPEQLAAVKAVMIKPGEYVGGGIVFMGSSSA